MMQLHMLFTTSGPMQIRSFREKAVVKTPTGNFDPEVVRTLEWLAH
jgi:hypothetical protein